MSIQDHREKAERDAKRKESLRESSKLVYESITDRAPVAEADDELEEEESSVTEEAKPKTRPKAEKVPMKLEKKLAILGIVLVVGTGGLLLVPDEKASKAVKNDEKLSSQSGQLGAQIQLAPTQPVTPALAPATVQVAQPRISSAALAATPAVSPKLSTQPAEMEKLAELSAEEKAALDSAIKSLKTEVYKLRKDVISIQGAVSAMANRLDTLETLRLASTKPKSRKTEAALPAVQAAEVAKRPARVETTAASSTIRIIDGRSVEIGRKVYYVGDVVSIKDAEYLLFDIKPGKGVYLQDKLGEKWLLKN